MASTLQRAAARLSRLLDGVARPGYRERLAERSAMRRAYYAQVVAPGLVRSTRLQADIAQWGSAYAEPILQMTQRLGGSGVRHDTQLLLFHAMRQYSPTLDAAIGNRRMLEGNALAVSDDEGLQDALNDVIADLPVGYLGGRATLRGVNTYADMLADGGDEYGLGVGEMLTDEQGRELTRLVVPNMRTISMEDRDRDGIHELYQRQSGSNPALNGSAGGEGRLDDSPMVQVYASAYATESPWPCPLAWSAVKSTEAVLRMYEAVINGWWRFGDPSLLLGMEFDKEADVDMTSWTEPTDSDAYADLPGTSQEVPSALLLFKASVEAVMEARRQGRVGDAYVSVKGGKVVNSALGQIDAGLMRYFREQASVFDGHVIALSRTPIWLYPSQTMRGEGLGSQLAHNEAILASVDAGKRNEKKRRIIEEVLDTWLILQGDARFVGRYDLEFDAVALVDEKLIAEARKTEAEAEAQIVENVVQLYDESGAPRFAGDADKYLRDHEVLPDV